MAEECGEEGEITPDYSKYNEDSVPPPERKIEHTYKGRPDLDYDETKVGPAAGMDYVPCEKKREVKECEAKDEQQHHHPKHSQK